MRNRASLVLLEQLIMVLVFALAAAVCLGFFAQAHITAGSVEKQDTAVMIAQNRAEQLKLGLEAETLPEGYSVELIPIRSGITGFARGEIRVYYGEECLFALETGWQEG